MSLQTDKWVVDVLMNDDDVVEATGGRIFDTVDDEVDPDSSSIPSVFVMNQGTTNSQESKDDGWESERDVDTITVGISARSRSELATLAKMVRDSIRRGARAFGETEHTALGFWLDDYQMSAGAVTWDPMKPCYWQELTYNCETINDEIE